MLITCWSVKGGSGTTVVAAVLALQLASVHAATGGALVADLAGDVPAALGLPDPRDPGLTGWSRADRGVAGDALARLELPAAPSLALLPRGTGALGSSQRFSVLAGLLAADHRPVVVDAGVVEPDAPTLPLVAQASRSLLVTRACHLALHRARRAPVRPSGVVLVAEPGRAYDPSDVAAVVGAPVVAEVPVEPAVARAVDAGLLSARLPGRLGPRSAVRGVSGTAEPVVAAVHQRVLDASSVVGALAPGALEGLVRQEAPLLAPSEVSEVAERVRARATGLGVLEPLLADPEVTEVMVNGPGPVWVERRGRLLTSGVVVDAATVGQLVARVLAPVGARADRSSPIADARLRDGSRVHVVVPPLAVDGPCLTIRRFRARTVPLSGFAPPPVVELLQRAVRERRQLVVVGGAGAGKTTLLNALAGEVPASERIVTIEDAAELRLPGEHVVRLEARPASAEGSGRVTVRDLVRAALRMRPDRIVVGEVRGPEALDMLQAMTTGHDGSLSTLHASSPEEALRRIETLVLMATDIPLRAVRDQIAGAIDLVVAVRRGPDGERRVDTVVEVVADEEVGVRTRALVTEGAVVAEPTRPPRAATWADDGPPSGSGPAR